MSESQTTKHCALGVDLGGTKIAAGLCREGQIIRKTIVPTRPDLTPDDIIESMALACREVMSGWDGEPIRGVGVGAAGQIDAATGAVLYAPNLRWTDVPLGATLSKKLDLPVKVVNDVRAATMAEWKFGAGKGLENFVNIFLGTGIGSGFVLNGRLLEGVTNSAGEIGHICMDPEGPVCGCGKKGCLEAFSSGRGVENIVKKRLQAGEISLIAELVQGDWDKVRGPIIGQAARNGDPLALDVLQQAGRVLGRALANVHSMLNPRIILLGGGFMALQEFFLPACERALNEHVLPVAKRPELLGRAEFTTDAGIIGSSALFA